MRASRSARRLRIFETSSSLSGGQRGIGAQSVGVVGGVRLAPPAAAARAGHGCGAVVETASGCRIDAIGVG